MFPNDNLLLTGLSSIPMPMAVSNSGMLLFVVFILGTTYTLSEARCNRRFITRIIRKDNCYPKAILSVACIGTCTSYTKPSNDDPWSVERFCECCREGSSREETVNMLCRDPSTRALINSSLTVMVPTSCMCRPCSVLPDTIIPGEQQSYQHTGIKRSRVTLNNDKEESKGDLKHSLVQHKNVKQNINL